MLNEKDQIQLAIKGVRENLRDQIMTLSAKDIVLNSLCELISDYKGDDMEYIKMLIKQQVYSVKLYDNRLADLQAEEDIELSRLTDK